MGTSIIHDDLYQKFLQLLKGYEQSVQRGEHISFEEYIHEEMGENDEDEHEGEDEDDTPTAQLKDHPVSTQHLLCLMEMWFDRTQPIVKALAEFNYAMLDNGRIGCPFCRQWYEVPAAGLVVSGFQHFEHNDACPVLQARQVRAQMLVLIPPAR